MSQARSRINRKRNDLRRARPKKRATARLVDDDDAPVRSNSGHRWTASSAQARWRRRGGLARKEALTATQLSAIGRLGAVIRWNKVRQKRGQPLLRVPVLDLVDTPHAAAMRRRRDLGRRMCEYDGIAYHDSMASSERVQIAYRELYAEPIDEERGGAG